MLLLEGTHLLQESFRTSFVPLEIIATSSWLKDHQEMASFIPEHVPLHVVTSSVLKAALTTKNPDGVAALFPLSALPQPREDVDFVLALDRLQDPGNLGTLFRTALAAEVQVVWLALGADPLSPKVLRSSAGAVLHLPFERFGTCDQNGVEGLVKKLKIAASNGQQVVAALVPDNSSANTINPYWCLDWRKPTVLVLGNEGSGLHPSIEACCTNLITLPHSSAVESLNVASASVPLLLERRRAKMTSNIQQSL